MSEPSPNPAVPPQAPGSSKKREAPTDDAGGGSNGAPLAKKPALDMLDDMVQRVPLAPHKEVEVTLLLPIDRLGLLIGKAGGTLKRVCEDSGAKLHIQEYEDLTRGAKQRGVTITGTLECVERAEREVWSLLKQRRITTNDARAGVGVECVEEGESSSGSSERRALRWLVDKANTGLLIGRKGIGLQQLSQESGAHIKVAHDQETPPGALEKVVYITGSPEAIERARRMIHNKVGGRACESGVEECVLVNTRAISYVLGKGGADLKAIAAASGAKIAVAGAAELEMGTVDIKIRVSGSVEAMAKAKTALQAKVDDWKALHPAKGAEDPDGQETSLKLAIPKVMISGLIGKGGVGVKDMNQKSGASVRFLPDEASHNRQLDEKPLLLIGGLRNVLTAQRILLERIAALPASVRQQARPKEPHNRPPRTAAASSDGSSSSAYASASPALLQHPVFHAPPTPQGGGGGYYDTHQY